MTQPIQARNRTCFCLTLDEQRLRRVLEADLDTRGLSGTLMQTHPHLFSAVPMFVSRDQLTQMARVVEAVETVVATRVFREAALASAPGIARVHMAARGGLLGFDFHLGATGPQLIEINTNPGGALLNAVLSQAQRTCCADVVGLAIAPTDPRAIEDGLFEVFITEWRLQRGTAALKFVAIVDEAPEQQYLYPEFLLYRQLFRRHDIEAVICAPHELVYRSGRVWHGDNAVDFVYNRLTDFPLEQPSQGALKLAYLADAVVVSPHPQAHALYADKRNLALLGDEAFLRKTGVGQDAISSLLAGVPRTQIVTAENRETLWTGRRQLFFKPAAGYGSKATYRGDKLTKRVWEEIGAGTYVAQALVAPSERLVTDEDEPRALKADIRNYAYAGEVKLLAARLYQGQTTNFRTPGGGFAPVFTEAV